MTKEKVSNKTIDKPIVIPRFSYDADGYLEAKNWLKEIYQWGYISTHGFSNDGWSIIAEANAIWDKKNK